MAHKKLRDNTQMIVYKFGAQPLGVLPDEFWNTARQVKNSWNDLVQMREDSWEEIKAVENQVIQPLYAKFEADWQEMLRDSDLSKDERQQFTVNFKAYQRKSRSDKTKIPVSITKHPFWKKLTKKLSDYRTHIQPIQREIRIPVYEKFDEAWKSRLRCDALKDVLGSDEREVLWQKFETADKRAKAAKTGLNKHFGLERIYFRHRYSSGGKSLADFRKQNSLGFSFFFPDLNHYQSNSKEFRRNRIGKGVFGIVKDREQQFNFSFSAVVHRAIPEDAIIKSVSWVGKRLKGSGINKKRIHESQRDWCWSIDVACEIPNQSFPTKEKVKVAALDVGWRSNIDYLRLGAMIDNSGNKLELRLLNGSLTNSARHGKLVSGIGELIALDERIGDLIQSTKDELAKLGVKHLIKMREGGLFRLARNLAETGENPQALELLELFKAEYLPLRSRRARSFDRMNKYRDWLYQNLAAWLAETYDVLIWEGKLNLKKMAEDRKNLNEVQTEEEKDREKIRRKSAKYRNYASIYSLRGYLKQSFAKRGKTIIDGVTAYSSRTCHECKTVVEKFANVEFVCPNGHNFDRDFNAAQNLLDQFKEQYVLEDVETLNIPALPHRNLSRMVVEV